MRILSQPTQDAMRFRLPEGTAARDAVVCADVATYAEQTAEWTAKGTTVFADSALSAAARPHVLDIPGVRCWSPPV